MRWSVFWGVTIAVLLITWYEWKRLKTMPKKDKLVLISLLLLVWFMSMLDLPKTPGPTTFLHFIFKPFRPLLES
ncbi:hypothetical protein GC093_29195 [Paenibacillus sp. LMG 31456]|uniref:Uncharacterized protein n=1 Tax=Paenibacillus foliorum TaxID=2654974 RepID=A0A972GZ87_9BACL|nr:hypothetical protein [Paenibacillus foliorum]NOU97274.1 hypothetical protein [Paenibacillus foliorum]